MTAVTITALVATAFACSTAPSPQPSTVATDRVAELHVDDPAIRSMLVDACYACHSDQRTDPWYAHLAPSSWSSRGRELLNFSTWNTLPPEKRKAQLAAIAAVVRDGYMPLKDYTFFNGAAKLDDAKKQQLASWADAAAAH